MELPKLMASTTGRAVRGIAGIVLIVAGALLGGGWWALSVVGLVPLTTGVLDVCLVNALFGQPVSGKLARAR